MKSRSRSVRFSRSVRLSVIALSTTLLLAFAITQVLANRSQGTSQPATVPKTSKVDPNPKKLSLLLYNLQLRPRLLFSSAQSDRAQKLPTLLQGYDALIFSEAFDDYALTQLAQALAPHYPYQSSPLGENKGLSQDSGLVIFSRWEIIGQSHQPFNNQDCTGPSCFNKRGAMLISINKNGQPYHLLTAQLQSGDGRKEEAIRDRQIDKINDLLLALNITKKEPIILAASLPPSLTLQRLQDKHRLGALSLNPITQIDNSFPHSVDPNQNTLSQSDVPHTPDVLFTLAQHRQPTTATWQVHPMRTAPQQAWNTRLFYWQAPQQNLSDHHAITSQFEYR
ncbi:MAG: hypothetical protein AB8B99_01670 [Phormidesmis sp.]